MQLFISLNHWKPWACFSSNDVSILYWY